MLTQQCYDKIKETSSVIFSIFVLFVDITLFPFIQQYTGNIRLCNSMSSSVRK